MTLVVSAYWMDPNSGEEIDYTDWDHVHHMAGPESARQELWGSASIKSLGAKYLPCLSEGDLWVPNEVLDEFEREVRVLSDNVERIRWELNRRDDCALPHYLANFLRAIETARQHGGGMSIS